MRAKVRRGPVKPIEWTTGIAACKCGKGDDRMFSGSFKSEGIDSVTCDRCHQVCKFETVALSRRQMRDLERHFSKPHVCKKR
jgi:hypothetical protein